MRVAVKKIDGVATVEVSLNRGLAVIRFRPDNRVTVEQVREAIRRKGFTPKAADVRIQGRAVERDGRLALELPGQNRLYALVDPPDTTVLTPAVARSALEKTVLIEGSVLETARGAGPVTAIQVRTLAVDPGA